MNKFDTFALNKQIIKALDYAKLLTPHQYKIKSLKKKKEEKSLKLFI